MGCRIQHLRSNQLCRLRIAASRCRDFFEPVGAGRLLLSWSGSDGSGGIAALARSRTFAAPRFGGFAGDQDPVPEPEFNRRQALYAQTIKMRAAEPVAPAKLKDGVAVEVFGDLAAGGFTATRHWSLL